MAMTDGSAATQTEVRQVTATLRPASRFPVPISDGYSVYSALLSVLSDVDQAVGQSVHDSPLGSLHCSGLQGRFGDSERSFHKSLVPTETYDLSLGIVHPNDTAVFQALVNALVLENEQVELSHGALEIEHFESENTTQQELLNTAHSYDDPTLVMDFKTATCIEEAGSVTTAFPHRWAVFNSLLGKWNRSSPDALGLDFDRETILSSVIEKPDVDLFDTHSVLTNRVENEDGETRTLFKQGFTGECAYTFKNASESVENAVTALALFAEYSGVGSAVARGCGGISVEVTE